MTTITLSYIVEKGGLPNYFRRGRMGGWEDFRRGGF